MLRTMCAGAERSNFNSPLIIITLLMLCAQLVAKTTMEIEAGYDGRYRIGRWSPVMVTVQSDKPTNAILELRVPTASESIVNIQQMIGIGEQKQTYILYAPLSLMYDPLRATLRDAQTKRVIAEFPDRDITAIDRGNDQLGFLMITTGRNPAAKNLQIAGIQGSTLSVHLKQSQLPISAIGYDAADVLLINNPDWSSISVDQQRAMIEWTRAGGVIVIQPGAEPVPEDALISAILPGKLKALSTIELSPQTLGRYGLAERFKTIGIRQIEPGTESKSFNILGESVKVHWGAVGLGRVAILPVDATALQFGSSEQFQEFWTTIITNLTDLKRNQPVTSNYYSNENPSQRAAHAALDQIGQIPNTGAFGFSYIAATIGILMLIVGPIDYFVLKKIGRQPWTWATTIGWIGLITTGALYAGHMMRSGELHFRTLSLIDQANDRLVGAEEIALIYSPKSASYSVISDPSSWWQPVPSGNMYSSRDTMTPPTDTHQDYRGNQPLPMWIDIWNWRFLRSTRYLDQPGMIHAELKITGSRIIGTITNRSPQVMKDIEVYYYTNGQTAVAIEELKAGESKQVEIACLPKPKPVRKDEPEEIARRDTQNFDQTLKTSHYGFIFGISETRNEAVNRMAGEGNAVVYATIIDPTSEIKLDNPKAIVQNNSVLRAVVELGK